MASPSFDETRESDLGEHQLLPVNAIESIMKENRKERGEKKKKMRRSSLRPSVYATRQDRYCNEELLPAVDEALINVVKHRKYTAIEIDELEKKYYEFMLQEHTAAPVDKSELEQMAAEMQSDEEAEAESRIKLEKVLKDAKQFMSARKPQSAVMKDIQEIQAIQKCFDLF